MSLLSVNSVKPNYTKQKGALEGIIGASVKLYSSFSPNLFSFAQGFKLEMWDAQSLSSFNVTNSMDKEGKNYWNVSILNRDNKTTHIAIIEDAKLNPLCVKVQITKILTILGTFASAFSGFVFYAHLVTPGDDYYYGLNDKIKALVVFGVLTTAAMLATKKMYDHYSNSRDEAQNRVISIANFALTSSKNARSQESEEDAQSNETSFVFNDDNLILQKIKK